MFMAGCPSSGPCRGCQEYIPAAVRRLPIRKGADLIEPLRHLEPVPFAALRFVRRPH